MIIYEKVKRYDQITGKPKAIWGEKEIRCDYTGEILDCENMYCTYVLNYEGQDPCFGSGGDEYKLAQDFGLCAYTFFSETYHFLSVGGSDSKDEVAEWQMIEEAMKNCKKKDSIWHRCYTFDAMCRTARARTARMLVENKIITKEQLEMH